MANKKQELAPLTEEQLAELNAAYPVADEGNRLSLPKFGMLAKDLTEESGKGKTKTIKVIESAGTFYTERDEGEVNEEGKKIWTKTFLGETVDVQIVYHRYQLRFYDKGLEKFISSPIYDNPDQVIPLYLDKRVVATGTEAELQALYPAKTAKGKPTSNLKKMTILYVVYEGELYQFGLSTSSGWEFSTYRRKTNPSTVITTLASTEETFGSNTFNKTTFNINRPISQEEFDIVKENQDTVRSQVEVDAQFLLGTAERAKEEIDAEEVFKDA